MIPLSFACSSMSITVEDYCVIADRAKVLGLVYPRGLAILPRNFDSAAEISEIAHEDSTGRSVSCFAINAFRGGGWGQVEYRCMVLQLCAA